MGQTRSESCDTPSVPCHDSLPYDPACVLYKHIDSWCSIFVTMKGQKTFTVVRCVMSSWAIAICVWKRIKLFPYFLKAKFIFFMSTTQYLKLSASVSSAAIHLPEQSTRHYKDAGEDAN